MSKKNKINNVLVFGILSMSLLSCANYKSYTLKSSRIKNLNEMNYLAIIDNSKSNVKGLYHALDDTKSTMEVVGSMNGVSFLDLEFEGENPFEQKKLASCYDFGDSLLLSFSEEYTEIETDPWTGNNIGYQETETDYYGDPLFGQLDYCLLNKLTGEIKTETDLRRDIFRSILNEATQSGETLSCSVDDFISSNEFVYWNSYSFGLYNEYENSRNNYISISQKANQNNVFNIDLTLGAEMGFDGDDGGYVPDNLKRNRDVERFNQLIKKYGCYRYTFDFNTGSLAKWHNEILATNLTNSELYVYEDKFGNTFINRYSTLENGEFAARDIFIVGNDNVVRNEFHADQVEDCYLTTLQFDKNAGRITKRENNKQYFFSNQCEYEGYSGSFIDLYEHIDLGNGYYLKKHSGEDGSDCFEKCKKPHNVIKYLEDTYQDIDGSTVIATRVSSVFSDPVTLRVQKNLYVLANNELTIFDMVTKTNAKANLDYLTERNITIGSIDFDSATSSIILKGSSSLRETNYYVNPVTYEITEEPCPINDAVKYLAPLNKK